MITADWNRVASNLMYPMPAYLTVEVGSKIAKLLENLVNLAVIDPSDIHVIGHSLGAHVSGACGAAFNLGKIGRITGATRVGPLDGFRDGGREGRAYGSESILLLTYVLSRNVALRAGLDPAGPGFEYVALRTDRLDFTDAEFVDVIHTASGTAGYSKSIGTVDFYPNGGQPPQPGCLESYTPSAFAKTSKSARNGRSPFRRTIGQSSRHTIAQWPLLFFVQTITADERS